MYSEDGDDKSKSDYWKGLKKSLIRYTPIAVLAGIIVIPDKNIGVVTYACGIILLFFLLAHVIRKQLFPYIKFESLVETASQNPIGAAICFASVCYLLATIFSVAVGLLS